MRWAGVAVLASLICLGATPVIASARRQIRIRAHSAEPLCKELIIDEASVSKGDPAYLRMDGYVAPQSRSDPWGSEIVSIRTMQHDLEHDAQNITLPGTEYHDGNVTLSHFDILNRGDIQNVYHLFGGSHYFAGDIYIATDGDVAEALVASSLASITGQDGDLDDVSSQLTAHGWKVFEGKRTMYQDSRYTTILPFRSNGLTYLAVSGIARSPIAIVLKPQPDGMAKVVCLFDRRRPVRH